MTDISIHLPNTLIEHHKPRKEEDIKNEKKNKNKYKYK